MEFNSAFKGLNGGRYAMAGGANCRSQTGAFCVFDLALQDVRLLKRTTSLSQLRTRSSGTNNDLSKCKVARRIKRPNLLHGTVWA